MVGPATESTRHFYDHVAGIYFPIMVGVGGFVMAAIIFVALRYARRPGVDGPVDRKHESHAEYAYVLVLICAAVGLLYVTYSTEGREDPVAEHYDLAVTAIASQWHWEFDYPQYGIRDVGTDLAHVPTLVVPVDKTVLIDLSSSDVIHAFWIPQQRFKRDAFPARPTKFDMKFTQVGFFKDGGECSEFCGQYHAQMKFDLRVLKPAAFRAWAEAHRGQTLGVSS